MGRPKLATVCSVGDAECSPGRIRSGLCARHYRRTARLGRTNLTQHRKTCAACGVAFESPQSRARFCSTVCRDRDRYTRTPSRRTVEHGRRYRARPPRRWSVTLAHCRECGAGFQVNHGNRVYCGEACERRVAERNRPPRPFRGRRHLLTSAERTDLRLFLAVIRGDPCAYCGAPMQHFDHIEPVSSGGPDTWDNFTAACGRCNLRKSDMPLLRYLLSCPIGGEIQWSQGARSPREMQQALAA